MATAVGLAVVILEAVVCKLARSKAITGSSLRNRGLPHTMALHIDFDHTQAFKHSYFDMIIFKQE